MREAALQAGAATSQPNGFNFAKTTALSSLPLSIPPFVPVSTIADWGHAKYHLPSSFHQVYTYNHLYTLHDYGINELTGPKQHGNHYPYASWVTQLTTQTPPESVDLGRKTLPLHPDPITCQSPHTEIHSSPPQVSASMAYVGDI
jgi:hypothetical protein